MPTLHRNCMSRPSSTKVALISSWKPFRCQVDMWAREHSSPARSSVGTHSPTSGLIYGAFAGRSLPTATLPSKISSLPRSAKSVAPCSPKMERRLVRACDFEFLRSLESEEKAMRRPRLSLEMTRVRQSHVRNSSLQRDIPTESDLADRMAGGPPFSASYRWFPQLTALP